ncbi:spermatogenesis-associated protein 7 [Elysia marginata]|uniref:Spermatogenesis-associated protein 7 n=1 Tax=Elysia marginata TaxID=1093978 RepID=A0AAV4J6C9_9GAST|nr:spermatogenesis-associated protein 7 [Elysia marginata]
MVHSPRLRPTTSMSNDGFQTYQDVLNDEPEDEEDKLVHSIMKSALLDKTASSTVLPESQKIDTKNLYLQHQDGRDSRHSFTYSARPGSARSVHSGHSLGPSASRLPMTGTSHDPTRITYQGDVLEKRPYLFTEPERPFTPRTLKNNHQSRLKNSKCYNPPPAKGLRSNGAKQSQLAPEVRTAPRPRPRSGVTRQNGNGSAFEEESCARRDSFHGLGETMETTGQLSESMLMDITLRSRDGRHYQQGEEQGPHNEEHGQKIPPLAISMDQDHMHWLQEQASKAQVRARNREQLRSSSLHSDEEALRPASDNQAKNILREDSETNEMIKKETMQNTLDSYYNKMRWPSASRSNTLVSCSSSTSWVSQCIKEQEEDQKYLAFAKEVTDDVLSRGICSDSVLNRVFENHIERKKNELDENRMREVIRDLHRDLGLRDSSAERIPHAALSQANYNNHNLTGPVTVVTNGENGTASSNQLPSSSSKGTTESTSAKDESSSTLSPANHMRSIIERGSRNKNDLTSTSLEPLNVMSSPSENDGLTSSATMESVSSFKFGQTGNMVDTITSEAIQENTAREREEEEEDNADKESESNELTATQALKQYEFDLTVKEGTAEQSATNGTSSREESDETTNFNLKHKNGISRQKAAPRRNKLERPATGERRVDEDSNGSDVKSDSPNERGGEGAKNNHRFRRREEQQKLRNAKALDDSSHRGSGASNQTTSMPEGLAKSNSLATNEEDDGASVKSSSSQRPSARPRRSKLQHRASEERRGQEQEQEISQVQARSSKEDLEQEKKAEVLHQVSDSKDEQQSKDGDYEDDYEEEEAEDIDESTLRTSDDDF